MSDPPPLSDSPARVPTWAGPLAVAGATLVMLAWTWAGWADPVVDFGREVYVPWRLAAGEQLYLDLAYQYGPLSPYLNALCFWVGDSWWVLLGLNMALLASFQVGLYALTSRLGGRLAASAVGVLFACLFAFAQLGPVGSFNFVTPYAHAATHGLFLAFAALGVLGGYLRRPGTGWAAALGACVGLAFLTKPEGFLGALLVAGVGLGACGWTSRATRQQVGRHAGVALGAALVPPLAAFCLLACAMPAGVAWAGTLGSWAHSQNAALRELVTGHFYAVGMGTDDVPARLGVLLIWSVGYGGVLGACTLVAWRLPARGQRSWQAAVLAGLLIAVLGVLAGEQLRGYDWASPLPLAVAGVAALELRRLRAGVEGPARRAAVMRLAWGAMSLGFLAKMLLNARLSDYGFVLALPGSAFCAAALVGWLPARLETAGRAGGVLRAGSAALGVVLVLQQLAVMHGHVQAKTERLGVRADETIRVDARGKALQELLSELESRLGPEQTLLVLPEGALLNYLLRRRVPTNGVTFVPTTVLVLGGEARVLEGLQSSPPDFVAYVHRDTAEYGPDLRYFGRDYGQAIDAWIREAYTPLLQVGASPLQRDAFGVLLWERGR